MDIPSLHICNTHYYSVDWTKTGKIPYQTTHNVCWYQGQQVKGQNQIIIHVCEVEFFASLTRSYSLVSQYLVFHQKQLAQVRYYGPYRSR